MVKVVSSAFWEALQQDGLEICELIELDSNTKSFRWTTCNVPIVSSGTTYLPFPGGSSGGIEESSDLGVTTIDFTMINSGGQFDELLITNELDMASVVVRRVFINTPDLGSMEIYRGKLGDYQYSRTAITGEARNIWNSANIDWPYYTYMDQCSWRFGSAGCGVNVSSNTVTGSEIVSVSSQRVFQLTSGAISPIGDGYYQAGRFTFLTGANSGIVRSIFQQSSDLIGLSHPVPYTVTASDQWSISPGCRKRLVDDCTSKFNNSSNFLGFPWIPRQEAAI